MFLSPFRFNNKNSNTSINPSSQTNNKVTNIDTTELDLLLANPKFNNLLSNHIQIKFNREYSILKNNIENIVNDKLLLNQEKVKLDKLKEQLDSKELYLNNLSDIVTQKLKQNNELEKNIQVQIQTLNNLKRKHSEDNYTSSSNGKNIIKIRKLNSLQRQTFDNDNSDSDTESENDENDNIKFTQVQIPSLTGELYTLEKTIDDKYFILKIDNKYNVLPLIRTVEPLLATFYNEKFGNQLFYRKRKDFILFEDYVKVYVKLEIGKRHILCLTGKGLIKLSSFILNSTSEENNNVIDFIKKYNCLNYFKPIDNQLENTDDINC